VSRRVPTDLQLRRADRDDLAAVAALHLRVRAAAVPAMPPIASTAEEVRTHVERWDLDSHELWLATRDDVLIGYAMAQGDWLHSLYVDPGAQGEGVGTGLLDLVKSLRPDGFCLYVFESNRPARQFYSRHGLVELETSDGLGNAEGAPDVRMAWPGADPLAFLRDRIDDVDASLGDLLARRTALTRAVQAVKPTTERDPQREAEIVARVAAAAPELGEQRVARIVHAIISESLDAALESSSAAGPG
jgi:chorismate mutase/GNAT superfamily N-acetyltransferase